MTENSVYELRLLYVLESVIITVVRIQGFTTFPSLHIHRTSSRYFQDRIQTCITVFEISYAEKNASTSVQTLNLPFF